MRELLSEKTPIEVAQFVMNKCFRAVREYEYHAFIPVAMLPRNAVTYFEKNQYVLYSKNRILSRQKALNMLKVVADESRIRIIDFLQRQLEDKNENGNYKEYSIHRENGENLIKELEGIILKNTDHKL